MAEISTTLTTILFFALEISGIITAVHAVMHVRTSRGAVAWAISLITFPFISLPLYWVFGRRKFSGYIEAHRLDTEEHKTKVDKIICSLKNDCRPPDAHLSDDLILFENLGGYPFTTDNRLTLLVNGSDTFRAMFKAMEQAQHYVLVQYYIIHDDELGRDLKRVLKKVRERGVKVYCLYDEIGCYDLPGRYIQELRKAGILISGFKTTRGKGNRFQLNFRNHRKITVVDGHTAFIGGHNIGDEYMGCDKEIGNWRDTQLMIQGPAARHVQLSFVNDWHWATRQNISLHWQMPAPLYTGAKMLILPTGPADPLETCALMFVHAINSAAHRVWIASPYFVPNEAVINALQLAALKGVDVRIILPNKADHKVVHLASFYYIELLSIHGIQFYRYQPGFLHQKVFLVDDHLAAVGTANADNRSFSLNFEITALVNEPSFVRQISDMLETDMACSRPIRLDDAAKKSSLFKFGVQLSRLLSPVL